MAKRAQRSRNPGDPLLERNQIAKRDGYRCGLCGKKVDMRLRYPKAGAPSIDHVIPLSLGGGNDLANLQLTHLGCNLAKRATAANEQLRAFG